MKAIVFEDNSGIKNFIVFESTEKLLEVFSKICIGSGCIFCTSKDDFESLRDEFDYALQSEIIYKNFLGIGPYDLNGNFHNKISQNEGKYWISDYSEITTDITTTKTKLEFIFLN